MLSVLLLVPLWLGYLLIRRVFGESNRPVALALTPAAGCLLFLGGVDYLAMAMPLRAATLATLALCGALALGLLRLPSVDPDPLPWNPPSPRRWRLILGCSVLVGLFAHVWQYMYLDVDNRIHGPVIGLFLKGNHPPHHPMYPSLPLSGHYGRDLLLAAMSSLVGCQPFTLDWLTTDVVQAILVPCAFVLFYAMTGRELQAVMATVFAFFGINVAYRAGLMDWLQNMNPWTHLGMLALVYLAWRTLSHPRPGRLLVTGLLLGVYPLVNESYYALLVAAWGTLCVLLTAWQRSIRPHFAAFPIIVALSLPLAATEGGQITFQVQQMLGRVPELAQGEGIASQKVSPRLKTDRFLQVYLAPGYWQRVSAAWWVLSPTGFIAADNDDEGYVPVWQPKFLKMFWLPLYLAPFTFWTLWKRRHAPGMTWWLFGMVSFLIPCVINFGPHWEEEYLRWFGPAGLGLAVALGVVAATFMEHLTSLPLGTPLKLLVRASIVLFVALNLLGAGSFTFESIRHVVMMARGEGGPVSSTPDGWTPDVIRQAMAMARFDVARGKIHGLISRADLDAAHWLWQQTGKGSTFMRNFEEDEFWAMFADAIISSLGGAYELGHAVPSTVAETNFPHRQSEPARHFWQTGDVALLRQMGVQWLYLDANRLDPEFVNRLLHDDGLRLGVDLTDEAGQRRVVLKVL